MYTMTVCMLMPFLHLQTHYGGTGVTTLLVGVAGDTLLMDGVGAAQVIGEVGIMVGMVAGAVHLGDVLVGDLLGEVLPVGVEADLIGVLIPITTIDVRLAVAQTVCQQAAVQIDFLVVVRQVLV